MNPYRNYMAKQADLAAMATMLSHVAAPVANNLDDIVQHGAHLLQHGKPMAQYAQAVGSVAPAHAVRWGKYALGIGERPQPILDAAKRKLQSKPGIPGEAFVKRAMGEIRRAFMSGEKLDPVMAGKLERLVERFGNRKARQLQYDGQSIAPMTMAKYIPRANMLSISMQHFKPGTTAAELAAHRPKVEHFEANAIGDFDVYPKAMGTGAWKVQHDRYNPGTMIGKTGVISIKNQHQQRGLGSGSARVMDEVMSALGANHLETTAVNREDVIPYRLRQGYIHEYDTSLGSAYLSKHVADTPAVARDRAMVAARQAAAAK